MQILVVEDDVRLAQALCRILEESGYKTDAVHDGQSGLDYAESGIYDVVILDVMLPKMDGFTVVSNLRRAGVNTPVLLLTARDAVPDKICGLDSGADDYMTKPFSPAELMAHLRALTRRQGEVLFEAITSGDVSLNLESHDLTWRRPVDSPQLQGVLARPRPYGERGRCGVEGHADRESVGPGGSRRRE